MPARRLRRGCAVLLIVCCTALGAAAQTDAQQTAPAADIEAGADAQDDAQMQQRLRAIYLELEAFRDVVPAVSAGVVTLSGTAADPATAAKAERLAQRLKGVVAVRNRIEIEGSVREQLSPAYARLAERAQGFAGMLPLIAVGLLVFGLFVALGLWAARRWTPPARLAPNQFVADLVRQVVRVVFVVAGAVIALDIVGATALLGTLLGTAGIVGLAIGFAVRDTIENYIASFLLSVRQPFRPNDHVRIVGYEGHVIRLTSRATIIMTLAGNHVRIPNATVYKGVIENFTAQPERRFEFVLGVDADASLREALAVGRRALGGLDFVLDDPPPLAVVQDVGESNVLLWFAGWIDQRETDFAKARGESIRLVKRALESAGFGLPEPIYRLRVDEAPPPAAPRQHPAPAESAEPGATSKTVAVEEKVVEERARTAERDLLDPARPTE